MEFALSFLLFCLHLCTVQLVFHERENDTENNNKNKSDTDKQDTGGKEQTTKRISYQRMTLLNSNYGWCRFLREGVC